MRHVLRYNHHDIELSEGRFVIGRATSCQLSLDDPLISRNHAMLSVSAELVTVEDLGSRNGVRVNGERIDASRALAHGDQITVGSQQITLLSRRDVTADTLTQKTTERATAFGLMGILADKALAMGRGEEAERLLVEQLEQVLVDLEHGLTIAPETTDRACDYALKLAHSTANGRWVNYIFRYYAALKRPCPGPIVDELYTVLRRVKGVNLALLRSFLDVLRANINSLGPAERFLVNRIEGLERVASAK